MAWPLTVPANGPDDIAGPGGVVPGNSTAITTGQVFLLGLHFINTGQATRTVTVTNTAGKVLYRRSIPALSDSPPYDPAFRPSLGLKWSCDDGGAGDVLGHIWGY